MAVEPFVKSFASSFLFAADTPPPVFVGIPETGLAETYVFANSTFTSRNKKEQTGALSLVPKIYSVIKVGIEEFVLFDYYNDFVKNNKATIFLFPDYTHEVYIGSVAATDKTVEFDTTLMPINAGDYIGVLNELTEEVTAHYVISVSPTEITFFEELGEDISGAAIMPLRRSYFDQTINRNYEKVVGRFNATIVSASNFLQSLSNYVSGWPVLNGTPVLPLRPLVNSAIDETVVLHTEKVSIASNDPTIRSIAAMQASATYKFRLTRQSRALASFLAFISSTRGGAKSFWFPSYSEEVTVIGAASGDGVLTATDGLEIGALVVFDAAGTPYYHEVLDITGDQITISPSLSVEPVTFRPMKRQRIADGRIAFEHQQTYTTATVNLREVL